MDRKPSKIHNLDGTLIPINISYLTFWNILKPLETSFIPDWPMKRKDLSFLGCNSRLAWAIIFERLETIILFLINEFAMNQRISFFLRNFIGDSKLVRNSFLFENWAFQKNRTYENRAFQKKSTWWEFEQKRERNWKCSNFGHFKINEHMPSREKFIFHMLFRAFYNTPRIRYWKL